MEVDGISRNHSRITVYLELKIGGIGGFYFSICMAPRHKSFHLVDSNPEGKKGEYHEIQNNEGMN